jgi:Tol biopolymer transport system component
MLLGGRLFTGETVSDTLAAVLRADPDWEHLPKDLPRPVSRLLRRALERDPRRRLRDAGDARLELEAALRGEEADVGGPAVGADTAAAPVRVRLWRATALVLLLATAGLGTRVVLDRLAKPTVVRSTILAPPETQLYLAPARPGPATLSRDGRQIAFTAATADGSRSLWVRPVDSLLARELPGTEEAQYPFWSPDGRHVGFFARDSLKKIAVAGGPPVTLCDCAPNGKGGTWSPEGLIVFAPATGSGLRVVSAAGGEPRELTTLDEKTESSHRHPRFLPDGRHFLFLARRNSQGNELRVGSTDGDAPRGLLETPANAEYARGRLLFLRDTTLMAQPFDADRAELGGEAIPLVENVLYLSGAALAVFSSSAEGSLIYQEGTGTASTRLVWRGRDGQELGTLGDEPADERQPALSPDGRLVAVGAWDPDTGTADIWIHDVERNLRTRLTFDAADDFAPRFSPDGRTLVFSSERDGQSATLWTVPVAGTGQPERLAAAGGRTLVATSWSPDGQWIVATAVGGGGAGLDIMVVPAQGGDPEPLIATQFNEAPASVSPDGRWVAYRSDETGRDEVYVTSFPKPGRKWQVSRGEGHMPSWRGDGREIYYRDIRTLYAAAVDGSGETFVPGEVTALFDPPPRFANGRQYEPSRDGQRFLVVEPLQASDASPITLVLNWDAALER